MELPLRALGAPGEARRVNVSERVFAADFREPLVAQVLTAYLAGRRRGTQRNKSRADARGGGAKPWRQKGLGRARAGSSRSPIWRGGGVTFAARPRDYSQKINRKMYRGALRSIFSELVRQDRLIVVDAFVVHGPKTKLAVEQLERLELAGNSVLIVTGTASPELLLASRNLPRVTVCGVHGVNPHSLIAADKVVVTEDVLAGLEAWLG
ncbi:MAG: 50S ribosomal protein L4 [Gammaproteobacteria bacterium]|nr:50S ribosomal protein L4 [Gammaproteobacteria bacterium]MDD9824954.1 50S ribosomal protein L4 [Gammaproteobacteria bacterium]MDD9863611.1 50S ribosomal protein L4 [Gammaproteobacteria bacterium]